MIVIDACVALKWFVEESDTKKAVHIQERLLSHKLTVIVPDLFFYEVTNVLKMKAVTNITEVISAVQVLFDSNLRVVPVNRELMEMAAYISDKFDISIYDSIYVAIAKDFNCPLITADGVLINKVNLPIVKHLSHYI